MSPNYKKAQRFFGILFIVSFAVLLFIPVLIYFNLRTVSKPLSNVSTPYISNISSNVQPVVPIESNTPREQVKQSEKIIKSGKPSNKKPVTSANKPRPAIDLNSIIESPVKSNSNVNAPQTFQSPLPTPTANVNRQIPMQDTTSDSSILLTTAGLSLFSTVISFLGFVSTTFFAWRREKQDKENLTIEREAHKLEVEHLKLELEKNRQIKAPETKQCPVCKKTYSDKSLNFCLDDGAVLTEQIDARQSQPDILDKTLILETDPDTKILEADTLIDNRK
jgi:hypothetical protein